MVKKNLDEKKRDSINMAILWDEYLLKNHVGELKFDSKEYLKAYREFCLKYELDRKSQSKNKLK